MRLPRTSTAFLSLSRFTMWRRERTFCLVGEMCTSVAELISIWSCRGLTTAHRCKLDFRFKILNEMMLPVGINVAIFCTAAALATGRPLLRISISCSCCARVIMMSRVPLILYLIWKGQRMVSEKGHDNVAPFFLGCLRCQKEPCSGLRGEVAFLFW